MAKLSVLALVGAFALLNACVEAKRGSSFERLPPSRGTSLKKKTCGAFLDIGDDCENGANGSENDLCPINAICHEGFCQALSEEVVGVCDLDDFQKYKEKEQKLYYNGLYCTEDLEFARMTKNGDSCSNLLDCASMWCSKGTCRTRQEGAECDSGYDGYFAQLCDEGLYCAENKKCAPLEDAFGQCTSDEACGAGMVCVHSKSGSSRKVCTPILYQEEGDYCETPDDPRTPSVCAWGLSCVNNRCTTVEPLSDPCTDSDPCVNVGYEACLCEDDNGDGVCEPYVNLSCTAEGHAFQSCAEQAQCPHSYLDSPSDCLLSVCSAEWTNLMCCASHGVDTFGYYLPRLDCTDWKPLTEDKPVVVDTDGDEVKDDSEGGLFDFVDIDGIHDLLDKDFGKIGSDVKDDLKDTIKEKYNELKNIELSDLGSHSTDHLLALFGYLGIIAFLAIMFYRRQVQEREEEALMGLQNLGPHRQRQEYREQAAGKGRAGYVDHRRAGAPIPEVDSEEEDDFYAQSARGPPTAGSSARKSAPNTGGSRRTADDRMDSPPPFDDSDSDSSGGHTQESPPPEYN